jgi:hypothetical protein
MMGITVPPAPVVEKSNSNSKKKAQQKKKSGSAAAATGIHPCRYCHREFPAVRLLNIHYHTCGAKPQTPAPCPDCDYVATNASYLNLHRTNCKVVKARRIAEQERQRQEDARKKQEEDRKRMEAILIDDGKLSAAEIDSLLKAITLNSLGAHASSSSSTEGSPSKKPRAKKSRATKRQKLTEQQQPERIAIDKLALVSAEEDDGEAAEEKEDNSDNVLMTDAPAAVAAPRMRFSIIKPAHEEEGDAMILEAPQLHASNDDPLPLVTAASLPSSLPVPKPVRRAPKPKPVKKQKINIHAINLVNDSDEDEREARSGDYSDEEDESVAMSPPPSKKRSRAQAELESDDDDEEEEEDEEEDVVPSRATRQSTELAQVLARLPSELTFAGQPVTHPVTRHLSALEDAAAKIPALLAEYQALVELTDTSNRYLYKLNKDEDELRNHSGLFFAEDMANGNIDDYMQDVEHEEEEFDLEAAMLAGNLGGANAVPEAIMTSLDLQKEYKELEKERDATKKEYNAMQHSLRARRLDFIKSMEPLQEKLKEAGVLTSVSSKNINNCLQWMRSVSTVFKPATDKGDTSSSKSASSAAADDGAYKCTICADNKHQFVLLNAPNCGHIVCQDCATKCRGECPNCRSTYSGYTVVHL